MLFCSKLRNFILVQKSILSEFSNPIRSCSKRMPANGVAETVTAYCPPSQYKTAVFCRTAVRSNSWWSGAAQQEGGLLQRWDARHPGGSHHTTHRTSLECYAILSLCPSTIQSQQAPAVVKCFRNTFDSLIRHLVLYTTSQM